MGLTLQVSYKPFNDWKAWCDNGLHVIPVSRNARVDMIDDPSSTMTDLLCDVLLYKQSVDAEVLKTMTGVWDKVKKIPNYEEEAGSVLFQK